MTPGEGLALYFDVTVWDSLNPLSRWVKLRFQSLVFSINPFSLGTAFEIGKTSLRDRQTSTKSINRVYMQCLLWGNFVFASLSEQHQFMKSMCSFRPQMSSSPKWQLLELSKCPFFPAFSMSAVPSCLPLSPADTTSHSARICYHLSACLAGGQYIWCTPVTPMPIVDTLKKSAVHLGAAESSASTLWHKDRSSVSPPVTMLLDGETEQNVRTCWCSLRTVCWCSVDAAFRILYESVSVIACFWVRIIQTPTLDSNLCLHSMLTSSTARNPYATLSPLLSGWHFHICTDWFGCCKCQSADLPWL